MKVILEKLPESFEEFQMGMKLEQTRPEHTCALLLCALELYRKDRNAGIRALNYLRGPRPMLPREESFLRDQLKDRDYLPDAYFEGAAPENSYTPHRPYTLEVLPTARPQDVEPGYLRVFLSTAGADGPRPVTLRRKGEVWCLWEYSGILTGLRTPALPENRAEHPHIFKQY